MTGVAQRVGPRACCELCVGNVICCALGLVRMRVREMNRSVVWERQMPVLCAFVRDGVGAAVVSFVVNDSSVKTRSYVVMNESPVKRV